MVKKNDFSFILYKIGPNPTPRYAGQGVQDNRKIGPNPTPRYAGEECRTNCITISLRFLEN